MGSELASVWGVGWGGSLQQDIQLRIKRHRRDSTLQPTRQKSSFGGDDMKRTDAVTF